MNLLDKLFAEVGTTENPPDSNIVKYTRWFTKKMGWGNGSPWCAIFVSWFLEEVVGIPGFRHAYTPTGVEMWKRAGRWHTDITRVRPLDVVYFDFPDSTFRVQHVGFAISSYNPQTRTVTTVEGNTSVGSSGSQDNGGGVYRRTRPVSYIVGFGRPPLKRPRKFRVVARKVINRTRLVVGREKAKMRAQKLRARGFTVKIEKK